MSTTAIGTANQTGGGRDAARVGNVDVLRAFAALSVLAIHAYAMGGRVAPIKAQHLYDVPLITLGTGVWLFFGISGYVISRPFVERLVAGEELPDLVPYALRRSFRIYPLCWVALSAAIAIDGAAGTHGWLFPLHYLLLNNLVPGRQEALFSPAWTLTLEVLFYAALPLLAWAAGRRSGAVSAERLARFVVVSWGLSVAFTVFADLQGDGEIGLWLRGSLPAMWQMFCPGILLAIAPHLRAPKWRKWVVESIARPISVAAGAVALLTGAVLAAAAPLRFGIVAYQLLVDAGRPLFAIGYLLLIGRAIAATSWAERAPWILRLGLVSYGIYLIHPVVEAFLLKHDLAPVAGDTLPAFVVNTAFLTALTVPLALLSWAWFEQPAIRLAGVLGRRWRARRRLGLSGEAL